MVGRLPRGGRDRRGQLGVDMETDAAAHCGLRSVEMGTRLDGGFDGANADAIGRCLQGDVATFV